VPSDALAYALVRTALFCLLSGHSELADELADTAGHIQRTGVELEPQTQAQSCVFRALEALYRGDFSTYLSAELRARDHFEEAGDARRALNESGSIGFAQMELGSYVEAEQTLVDALARAGELGLDHVRRRRGTTWAVYARLWTFRRGAQHQQRSLDVFRAERPTPRGAASPTSR
jgi:hypothetical protein